MSKRDEQRSVKRWVPVGLTALLAGSALAVAGPAGAATAATNGPATGSVVKIGFVDTLSGSFAQIGEDTLAGARQGVTYVNAHGGLDGHKVELLVKDEQATPSVTVQDVKSEASSGATLFMGTMEDADCLAAIPVVQQLGGMLIGTACQSNLPSTTSYSPIFYNIAPDNAMLSAATAQFATQEFPGVKSWRGVGPEYSFGTEVWDSFQQDLKKDEQGVSFPKNVYIPLTETQFSSYITSLQSGLPKDSASTNGLFMSTFSATTVGLAQQAKPFNLFGDFKAVLNLGGSTPTAVSLGKDTPPLYFIYDYDNQAYNNAMNTAFVSTYQKAHGGNLPDSWTEEGYAALLAYQAGATAAKSDGATKIASSLAGVSFQTPKGTMSFRKGDHVPLTPVSIWKVESAPSAKQGFKVTSAVAIPAAKVVPPVDAH